MRPGPLVPSRCRLPECMRMILPVAVTLKRFAAPRCVFSFFFGLEAFLGMMKPFSRGHHVPLHLFFRLVPAEVKGARRGRRPAAATMSPTGLLRLLNRLGGRFGHRHALFRG